jgi:putative tryptophan/tyrosine transport system substrate-binding protein
MNRKLLWLFTAILLVSIHRAGAQQPKKVPRIGMLFSVSASSAADRIEAFQQGLRELGYLEGSNIALEYRYAGTKLDRLPALAAELVRLKVDIIVTSNQEPTRSAKTATDTIPIVMRVIPIRSGMALWLVSRGRAAMLRVYRAWRRR